MNNDLPKPSALSLVLQSMCMIGFAVCLYLFGTSYQANSHYKTALKQLEERKSQLKQAYEQVDKYMIFIDTNPYYKKNLGEPQWEKVDETWVDLSYDKLLNRFSSLYREDRPFILDFFSASLEKDREQNNARGDDEKSTSKNRKLIFHLQGYYLCPCQ